MATEGNGRRGEGPPDLDAAGVRATGLMLANRERYLAERSLESLEGARPEAAVALTSDEARALVSEAAYDLIVQHETGGRAYYERIYKSRPVWPGYSSGVTIGFGFDLGYHTRSEFEAAWGTLLSASDIERLSDAVGKTGGAAEDLIDSLDDIKVPWGMGETVFRRHTLPKYVGQTVTALAHVRDLHPHASGALVSLVFNRGADFKSAADKRREMRAIRAAMSEQRYGEVPDELRAMQRLWSSTGLKSRRREEAALFERGLESAATVVAAPVPRPEPVPRPPAAAGGPAAPDPMPPLLPDLIARTESVAVKAARVATSAPRIAPRPSLEDDWSAFDQLPIEEIEGPVQESSAGRPVYRLADVRWVEEDAEAPDYRHIAGLASDDGEAFVFTAADLELLIAANRFNPARSQGKILFGLRGARLVDGPAVADAPALRLALAQPDHRTFRCVIGVCDLATRRLSGFVGSTVPHRAAVLKCWQLARAGDPPVGNMLPTGCYGYIVGAHKQVPGAFLLRETPDRKRTVAVLRSLADVVYAIGDTLDVTQPGDNIHPAFSATSAEFSSFGCQTVRGSYTEGAHTGEWALFRRAAGLDGASSRADDGKAYGYVLLTGQEARIAAALRERGEAASAALVRQRLARLRQGSQGPEVAALQSALGLPETGVFAAREAVALADWQARTLGAADAIYSAEYDAHLGRVVLGEKEPAPGLASSAARRPAGAESAAASGRSSGPRRGTAPAPAPFGPTAGPLASPLAQSQISALLATPDALLTARLGMLADAVKRDPRKAGQLDLVVAKASAEQESAASAFAEIGERLYARLEPDLFRLVCGTGGEDARDREDIKRAVMRFGGQPETGRGPIVVAVAGALIGSGAIWYGAALVIAAIFARRIAQATMEETCRVWGERRRASRGGAGLQS